MAEEISYILTTPYTLAKSRTGGVLSRLLSRCDLELVSAQILAFTYDAAEKYAQSIIAENINDKSHSARILSDYIMERLTPDGDRKHRAALFVFKGENACRRLSDLTGSLYPENRSMESITGETIRDTYADLLWSIEDPRSIRYFEPAVFTPPHQKMALENLKIFADLASESPNIVDNMTYPEPDKIERTLVIIKPDNWRFPSSRPGTIIDMFSRTGLRMVGCKIYRMSINEGLEFYGEVENVLVKKLSPIMGGKASDLLAKKFDIDFDSDMRQGITDSFGTYYAQDQFNKIIEFMTGRNPKDCPFEERDDAGKVKTMVLIYEGVDAVNKIRDVLGPTDPTKAPGGTVRREFGSDVMVNTAHASDSVENAKREMRIIKIEENNLANLVYSYIKERK